jgi:hypothetical protein
MHVLAPERPGARFAGPAPERLGYAPGRVPRPAPTDKAKLQRAHEFSKPSTATAVGARPPSRVAAVSRPGTAPGARPGGAGTEHAAPERGAESTPEHGPVKPGSSDRGEAHAPAPAQHPAPAAHASPAHSSGKKK